VTARHAKEGRQRHAATLPFHVPEREVDRACDGIGNEGARAPANSVKICWRGSALRPLNA